MRKSLLRTFLIFGLAFLFTRVADAATRTSVNSGNWGTASTWDCNCVPASTDDAVIDNNTTVDLNSNTTVNNITVMSGSTLNSGIRRLTVGGNYMIHGTHSGTGITNLDAFLGGTIGGSGNISNSGRLNINNGDYTISVGASFNKPSGNIVIANDLTLHNRGTATVGSNINGGNANSRWINWDNATLNAGGNVLVTGILIANATGNTVSYTESANQVIKLPQGGQYYHLSLDGTNTKRLEGNTTVLGNLAINSELDLSVSSYSLIFEGNWTQTGTFNARSGTVTLSGSGNQILSGVSALAFYDLTLAKSGGTAENQQDISVSNILTMTSGNLTTGSYKITLGTGTGVPGQLNYTAGSVIGNFERWITATAIAYTLPVGTATDDRPAIVTFSNLGQGSLVAAFVASGPGIAGLPVGESGDSVRNTYSEGYWQITAANGLTSTGYDLDLTASGFTSFTIDNSTRIVKRANSASNWILDGIHAAPVGNVIRRTGLNGFSEFAIGDTTNCTGPSTSAISGTDSVCVNATGIAYSVTNTPGSTYNWVVTGGSITAGQTTNAITVTWGATGMTGNVSVTETNSCTQGSPQAMNVVIHSLPVDAIAGNLAVPENSTGEVYSLTARPGYTYDWTVTGGTIASGDGTASISVNWGASGTGQVSVVAQSACGNAAAYAIDIDIYVVVNSIGTGSWNNSTTWDCGCVPTSASSVVIKSTHTITLSNNTTVNNLIIEPLGTLFDNNRRLIVNGNLTVNGNYTGSNSLAMSGSGKTLDGTGTISTSGDLRLDGGSKTVQAGANLNKSPGNIDVRDGTTVTNYGTILLGGAMTSNNAASTWINADGSKLTVGGALLSTGVLVATATGNTVEYNGATGQTIKATDYYNLSSTGLSTLTLNANMLASGSIYIGPGNTLNTNNFNIEVQGNWTNAGGTFNETTGTVTFNGTGAQTITAAAGESFNNLTIVSGSSVQLPSGSSVAVNGSFANSGTIDNDGTLTLVNGYSGNTGTLRGDGNTILTGGNWNPSAGVFTSDNGTITMQGSAAQTIAAANTFNNLTINNASGVAVSSGGQSVKNTLSLVSGNFNTNNNLTLLSNASRTARLDSVRTAASLTGTLTLQRYVTGDAGFRNVGIPFTDATFMQLNDDVTLTGMTGTGNGFETYWESVYYYDEDYAGHGSIDSGWVAVKNVNDAIDPTKGYSIWVYNVDLPATLDVTGTPYIGDKAFTLTYDNTGSPADDGWNLVNNPYPSSVDWDHGSVVRNGSLNNAIYVFRDDIQQYASYVAGLGTNGGSNNIPSMQAFWVQGNAAGPSLSMRETSKSPADAPFYAYTPPENSLRITLRDAAGKNDEAILQLMEGSTAGFDPELDARKLWSIGYGMPNIAVSLQGEDLSINRIPADTTVLDIPLLIRIENTGNHSLEFDISSMAASACLLLEDKETATMQDLRINATYPCVLDTTDVAGRFVLHIGKPMQVEATDIACAADSNGKIVVVPPGASVYSIRWEGPDGSVLREESGLTDADTLAGLPAGTYKVTMTGTGLCGNIREDITLEEPAPISVDPVISVPACSGSANGSILLTIAGGNPPYILAWSNGSSGMNLENLAAGTYTVTVSDALSCTQISSLEVEEGPVVVAAFQPSKDTLWLPDGNEVYLQNLSAGSQDFVWDFGDGSAASNLASPYHAYADTGTYTISLQAGSGMCADTVTHTTLVLRDVTTGTPGPVAGDLPFILRQRRSTIDILQNAAERTPFEVVAYDLTGRLVNRLAGNPGGATSLELPPLPGIYLIQVISGDRDYHYKVQVWK